MTYYTIKVLMRTYKIYNYSWDFIRSKYKKSLKILENLIHIFALKIKYFQNTNDATNVLIISRIIGIDIIVIKY